MSSCSSPTFSWSTLTKQWIFAPPVVARTMLMEVHLTIAASIVVEEPKTKVTLTSSEDDWENSDKEFQRVDDENHEQTPISFDTAISISEEPRDESPAIVDHPNQNTSVDLNSTNSTLEAIATSTPQEAKLEKKAAEKRAEREEASGNGSDSTPASKPEFVEGDAQASYRECKKAAVSSPSSNYRESTGGRNDGRASVPLHHSQSFNVKVYENGGQEVELVDWIQTVFHHLVTLPDTTLGQEAPQHYQQSHQGDDDEKVLYHCGVFHVNMNTWRRLKGKHGIPSEFYNLNPIEKPAFMFYTVVFKQPYRNVAAFHNKLNRMFYKYVWAGDSNEDTLFKICSSIQYIEQQREKQLADPNMKALLFSDDPDGQSETNSDYEESLNAYDIYNNGPLKFTCPHSFLHISTGAQIISIQPDQSISAVDAAMIFKGLPVPHQTAPHIVRLHITKHIENIKRSAVAQENPEANDVNITGPNIADLLEIMNVNIEAPLQPSSITPAFNQFTHFLLGEHTDEAVESAMRNGLFADALSSIHKLGEALATRDYHCAADFCFLVCGVLGGKNPFEPELTPEGEEDYRRYISLINSDIPDNEANPKCQYGVPITDLHATEISVEYQTTLVKYAKLLANHGFYSDVFSYCTGIAREIWFHLPLFKGYYLLELYTQWIHELRETLEAGFVTRQQLETVTETVAEAVNVEEPPQNYGYQQQQPELTELPPSQPGISRQVQLLHKNAADDFIAPVLDVPFKTPIGNVRGKFNKIDNHGRKTKNSQQRNLDALENGEQSTKFLKMPTKNK
ncbi:unnamed protein product [Caenorhabditis brenneri]